MTFTATLHMEGGWRVAVRRRDRLWRLYFNAL